MGGMGGEGGRETQEGGDMCVPMTDSVDVCSKKPIQDCKVLSFN